MRRSNGWSESRSGDSDILALCVGIVIGFALGFLACIALTPPPDKDLDLAETIAHTVKNSLDIRDLAYRLEELEANYEIPSATE